MTLFVFQVKKVGSEELDDITLCKDFDEVKSAFDRKVEWFRYDKFTEVKCVEPTFDEESESDDECISGGKFEFVSPKGTKAIGEVYPYWVED
jgi:hypothetical protein